MFGNSKTTPAPLLAENNISTIPASNYTAKNETSSV